MIAFLLSLAFAQPPRPPPGGVPPASPELVAEILAKEQQILEAVRAVDPGVYDRLMRLRDIDRGAYIPALMKAARTVERARLDPEGAERQRQIHERETQLQGLAEGFGALSGAEQKARRAELERIVGELMDLKQAERRAKLEDLRGRLEELEAEIEERERERARIVEEYVDQLVQERVDL